MTECDDAFMSARARLACKALRRRPRFFTPERLVSPHEYAVEGAQRFSIDARSSLTVSFLSSKEKKYAIRFRGDRAAACQARKNSKKILTPGELW